MAKKWQYHVVLAEHLIILYLLNSGINFEEMSLCGIVYSGMKWIYLWITSKNCETIFSLTYLVNDLLGLSILLKFNTNKTVPFIQERYMTSYLLHTHFLDGHRTPPHYVEGILLLPIKWLSSVQNSRLQRSNWTTIDEPSNPHQIRHSIQREIWLNRKEIFNGSREENSYQVLNGLRFWVIGDRPVGISHIMP